MEKEIIIDSHSHFGPSLSLGIEVTTSELISQMRGSGVSFVVIIPFPSTAIASNEINVRTLEESKRVKAFIPYHYIREEFDKEDFNPIPHGYYGAKWHWMRGRQDFASNYSVLNEEKLASLIEKVRLTGKPLLFEEELRFTEMFVDMAKDLNIIIPHLGLLGGNPSDFLNAFRKRENVYFDTSLAEEKTIYEFCKKIGPHRILFGSDVPFGNMRGELKKIMALPFSSEERSLLLYENFLRLTNYEVEKYEKDC